MPELTDLGKFIETDVLVIGGGPSGLWSANRAGEFVKNVLVVDKGPRDWGGQGSIAGGDFDAVLPGEDPEEFVKDLVYYTDGLCEQDLIEVVFKQSYDRLKDYQRFGCQFKTGHDGKLKGIPQRGLDHVKLYPSKLKGRGGADMIQGLLKEAERLGVKRLGRTQVTDLLKQGDRVVGAVGFNTWNGDFYIFKAKAVVVATGVNQFKTGYGNNTATGEGIFMAFRAGVELKNQEFAQVWNVPRLFAWESQTTLLPLGARFVNAEGEPFMDKYSPVLGANTDPHYSVMGMAFEARRGKAPIYFDVSPLDPNDRELVKPQTGWQLLNYRKLIDLGIDFFRDNMEWMPQFCGPHGGIVADVEGRTKVSGLFAAGVARGMDVGVLIGGFSLCRTAVTGYITGKTAADYAGSCEPARIDGSQVKDFKSRLYAQLGGAGIPPKEVLREIREVLSPYDVCIIKSEASLKRALGRIESIRDELVPQMGAADTHYLMKKREVQAAALTAELFLRASLMRTESRAGHYRDDYPDRDNENWLKWIVISYKDGGFDLRAEPLPFERYNYKPIRYYMDNFKFPK